MKYKFSLITLILVISLSNQQIDNANAAGSKPRLAVKCGQLIGSLDSNGTYALFKPSVTVAYYGLPLTVTSYYYEAPTTPKSETGQQVTTFDGKASSAKLYVSNVNIEQKILEYSQPQSGYYRFEIEAVDSLKRKASFVCTYEKYYFSMPIVRSPGSNRDASGTGGSASSIRGLNKASCTFNGKNLFGSVYFASSPAFVDFTVYSASSPAYADLNVYFASSSAFTSSCGVWFRTSSSAFADFTVFLANSPAYADFTIYPTSSSFFAGTN